MAAIAAGKKLKKPKKVTGEGNGGKSWLRNGGYTGGYEGKSCGKGNGGYNGGKGVYEFLLFRR